jgi:hypothetical protein
MALLINLAEQYLSEQNIEFERLSSREGLMAEMRRGTESFNVFVECDSDDNVFGIYIYSLVRVSEDKRNQIAELLTYINHGWIAFGCCHLDYKDGYVRYLHRVNLADGVLTLAMVEKIFNYGLAIMSRLNSGIMLVVYCDNDPKETYELIRNTGSRQSE